MALGFIILAFAMTAWSKNTASLPLKTSTLDMHVQQKPTQAFTSQGHASPTIPLPVPNPSTPPTIQPITPNPSTPPTIQSTMPHPSAASTSSHPTPSSSLNPTPTPRLTPTSTQTLQTTTIDDSMMGTGLNQFNYVGSGWQHCTNGYGGNPPDAYDGSNSWDNTAGDYVTISFTGIQIKFYDVEGSGNGIAAISLDGGSETMIDSYRAYEAGNQLLWTSPTLPEGTHTFKLRVTGTEDSSSSNIYIIADRVDIISQV